MILFRIMRKSTCLVLTALSQEQHQLEFGYLTGYLGCMRKVSDIAIQSKPEADSS
jgi:hypothetical protein